MSSSIWVVKLIKEIFFIMLLMSMVVSAQTNLTSVVCSSNNTLKIMVNETRCIEDICKVFSKESEEYCAYGCDPITNTCNPDPVNQNMVYVGIFAVFIIVSLYVVSRFLK